MQIPTSHIDPIARQITTRVIAQYRLDTVPAETLQWFRANAQSRSTDKRLPLGARRHWAAVVAACTDLLRRADGQNA